MAAGSDKHGHPVQKSDAFGNHKSPSICDSIYSLSFCFNVHPTAQKLLFQKNRYRQALYEAGDQIAFRLKGAKTKFSGKILGLKTAWLFFKVLRLTQKIFRVFMSMEKRRYGSSYAINIRAFFCSSVPDTIFWMGWIRANSNERRWSSEDHL